MPLTSTSTSRSKRSYAVHVDTSRKMRGANLLSKLKNNYLVMNEFLVLVDEEDNVWGKLEKLMVHQLGMLHRAFSVFIFNTKGELLLQQRADEKYHSSGLWSNTCCSHPQFGEEMHDAIHRRLFYEMGIESKTNFAFSFVYKVKFENGLIEHEYDHVYFGVTDDIPKPEKSEVKNWKYINLSSLEIDIEQHAENYSEWIKIAWPEVKYHHEILFHNLHSDPKNKL